VENEVVFFVGCTVCRERCEAVMEYSTGESSVCICRKCLLEAAKTLKTAEIPPHDTFTCLYCFKEYMVEKGTRNSNICYSADCLTRIRLRNRHKSLYPQILVLAWNKLTNNAESHVEHRNILHIISRYEDDETFTTKEFEEVAAFLGGA